MKQKTNRVIYGRMKKTLSLFAVLSVIIVTGMLAGCKGNTSADLVVYGKIFTSENNQVVEAFAVKDGKYVYVGDKAGAEAFVEEGKTEVLDYTGKGLVMPSCGNGHAHYSMGYAIQSIGTIMSREDDVNKFFKEIVPAAVKKAKDNGATSVFGQGWNMIKFPKDISYRQQLDAICSDIPIYFADEEGHKGLVNTIMLVKAGIMKEDGTVLKKEMRGGEIVIGPDGTPTGYLSEQAGTYVRSFMDNENLFPVDIAKDNMAKIQEQLLSEGYTMYLDGYSSYFFNDHFYQAAQQMDQAGEMHFVLGTAWELDSWMDVDATMEKARNAQKYASERIKTNWLKLFMDGTVESGTGFVDPLYPGEKQGIPNWSEEELTEITRKANANGVTMHVHVMGNKGVERVVNAFINGGKDEMRNTLIHIYSVKEEDYKRIAEHNIQVGEGLLWHHADNELQEELLRILPEGMKDKGYPMKSYFDHGINVASHSDFPALSGSPDDPFGIMEIAVTGVYHLENGKPWWTEELLTREQALTALTINVAKQMFIENERGSISTGKYADFLLVDKDVLTCPVTEIHTAKPAATYFEGKKVYLIDEAAEYKKIVRSWYGENKTITDGNYDQSLAVKCINGTFVGKKTDDVITFRGIPYVGKQPVGELRWKAPVDVTPCDSVYEAYYNAKVAPQPEVEISSYYFQDEECLYLNVWQPVKATAEKKPVIVWIHGGAYAYGGTVDLLYDFHNFVEENPDVIVVSVAYRLGVLGFLHLSHLPDGKDYPDAQNLGLMDQLKALKWVHENIAAFGGDPDNVTLMGESAGGGSVTSLSLVKGSHQYFNKVIALSGNPGLSTSTEEAIASTNELMEALDCKTVADLQKVDAQKLVGVATELLPLRLAPERDGNFLPRNPWEAVANGAVKDITYLHGVNKDEMNFFLVGMGGPEPFNEWAADRQAKKLALMTDEEKALAESFCSDVKGESYEPYCKWFSQLMFNAPCIRLSEEQTKAGGKSYTYYFTVESAQPLKKSCHGIALAPLFKHPDLQGDTGREFDATFSKTMRKMWAQFAKTGNPSLGAEISPDGRAKEWPLYDLKDKQVMVFDEFNIHPEKESQRNIIDWDRTYFLTKYYGF